MILLACARERCLSQTAPRRVGAGAHGAELLFGENAYKLSNLPRAAHVEAVSVRTGSCGLELLMHKHAPHTLKADRARRTCGGRR